MHTRTILIFLLKLILTVGLVAKPISIQDLFRDDDYRTFRLSPDGTKLAFLGRVEGKFLNIFVIDLETMASRLVTGEEANVNSFAWVSNERLVFSTDGANRVFNGVYGINADGSENKVLIEPVMQSTSSPFTGISLGARLFSIYPEDEESILIYDSSRRRLYPDISKLNVHNGRSSTFFKNPGDYRGFSVDSDYVVRFAYTADEKGRSAVYYRKSEDHDFVLLHDFEQDYYQYSVAGFTEDNKYAYVLTNHLDNTVSLYRLSMEDLSYEKIFSDPVYDLSSFAAEGDLVVSRKTGNLLGIKYEADKPVNKWFNPQFEQLQGMIDEAFPETVNQLINWDESQNKFILVSFSDRQPYAYRLLTINPLSVVDLQNSKPWINPRQLPQTRPIAYESRDGRTIRGYLTLPNEFQEGKPVPLVVIPHGGPWARDVWGFRSYLDGMRIFPATRGWAVLEVNFRGSTGYGIDHLASSYKHPHQMNHDVEDAVQWTVDQGYADPDHLGIMGASWGGYATMYGVTMTPDLYKFGVNIFGVVDLPRQINWYRLRTKWGGMRDQGYEVWRTRIGDTEDPVELAMLESASPLNFIDRIKADILVYHGTEDVNVDIEQSRILNSKLSSEGVDFEWISKANEHHTIRNMENRILLFNKVEDLLNKFGQ